LNRKLKGQGQREGTTIVLHRKYARASSFDREPISPPGRAGEAGKEGGGQEERTGVVSTGSSSACARPRRDFMMWQVHHEAIERKRRKTVAGRTHGTETRRPRTKGRTLTRKRGGKETRERRGRAGT